MGTTTIIKIIDISLFILLIIYGTSHAIETLIKLGRFSISGCRAFDLCHGPFESIVITIPQLFYLAPIGLACYTGLVVTFFRAVVPSWIFVIISVFFIVVLYEHYLSGLTSLIYLLPFYLVFRAIFIYQGQTWHTLSLKLMARVVFENRMRVLLFVALLVSVALFFPLLVDRVFLEIVNCEKFYPDCSERRLSQDNNLYQALYWLPVMVASFTGLYINEQRSTP